MSYLIHARLDEGRPCLQIVDAESGRECLHWTCACQPGTDGEIAQEEMHRLVRKLLLLTCRQELSGK